MLEKICVIVRYSEEIIYYAKLYIDDFKISIINLNNR